VQTTVVDSSLSLSSLLLPLYDNSGNYDNILPSSSTLQPNRPIPITIEEDLTPESVGQETEIQSEEIRDVAVRSAVRSRPVTARRTRVGVRGRAVSMPSRQPINFDVNERQLARLIPPVSGSVAANMHLGQLKEVGASDELGEVPEISIGSTRTRVDAERGCGSKSNTATISVPGTLSERPSIAQRRRLSHVTPDFDPPPPRRFDHLHSCAFDLPPRRPFDPPSQCPFDLPRPFDPPHFVPLMSL